MRKFVWLGAALLIVAATGSYWMADYAAKHPGSFCSRWLSAARIGLNLSCPGLGQMVPENGVGATVAAKGQAVDCVHPVIEQAVAPESRLPRVPKPTPKAQAEEPMEVIKIEHIDPQFARAMAEILDVPQIFHHPEVKQPKGPDQVVYTIIDGEGPIQLCNPGRNDTVPQAPQCPLSGGWIHQIRMPYCADNGESGNTCEPVTEGRQAVFQILFGPEPLINVAVSTMKQESTDLVMPYAEDDETDDAQQSETPVSVPGPDSETVPMPDEAVMPPATAPSYHHEHEGCPYLNGQYCPRYTPPYCPPAVQPEETQPQREQPVESEQREER